ncbi:kinase-like domain-containing protein [Armillaria fumosa]|nr:kinase-like domain-containing protein [Armillaria fumosa]
MEIMVMDVLQQELDDASLPDAYRSVCMRCLRTLSKDRNIVPSSLSSQDVTREGTNLVCGGCFSPPLQDIWKGRLHDIQVCLKVLQIFEPGVKADFCQEALVWRQLHHPNVLPFLGVSKTLFTPRYCLISPWMDNGNIMSYLQVHPDHNHHTSLVQVAEGMRYLHNLDPPIVHANIHGANILVTDDLHCCLADFGLSLFTGSQTLDDSSSRGSIRWLAPEYMDPDLFDGSCSTARDIYAYGCTIVEVGPITHLPPPHSFMVFFSEVFTGKPLFSDIKYDVSVMHEVTKGNCPSKPSLDVFSDDELWPLIMVMGPSDMSLSTSTVKLLNLPRLKDDGTNYILYKEQIPNVATAKGLRRVLYGTTKRPVEMTELNGDYYLLGNLAPLSNDEVEKQLALQDAYDQKEAQVHEMMYETVSISTFMQIKNEPTAAATWKKLTSIFEEKGISTQENLLNKLQNQHCSDDGDI